MHIWGMNYKLITVFHWSPCLEPDWWFEHMRFSFLVSVCHSALSIKRCLDLGADIVVTGRCVDSAVVLGPLMHSVRIVTQERSFFCATAVVPLSSSVTMCWSF